MIIDEKEIPRARWLVARCLHMFTGSGAATAPSVYSTNSSSAYTSEYISTRSTSTSGSTKKIYSQSTAYTRAYAGKSTVSNGSTTVGTSSTLLGSRYSGNYELYSIVYASTSSAKISTSNNGYNYTTYFYREGSSYFTSYYPAGVLNAYSYKMTFGYSTKKTTRSTSIITQYTVSYG